jgi:hypothetical protein
MIKAAFPPAATASYIIPTPEPSAAARAYYQRPPSFAKSGRVTIDEEMGQLTLAKAFSTPDFGTPPSLAFCNAAAKRGLALGSGERGGFID